MGLEKIEAFLGNHIEGFFNKRFASDLELVELAEGVKKEIRKIASDSGENGVPNVAIFTLSPDDYSRLCAQRVQAELYAEIEKEIIRTGTFMDGELNLRFISSPELQRGIFDLRMEQEGASTATDSTIVLNCPSRLEQAVPVSRQHKIASLTVLEGPDAEAYLDFGEQKIYIGRRDKNDFILTDNNASRLHAWVGYEQHRHVLYDAQSTNGTFVNDKMIHSCQLNNGDRVRIGSTLLKYEVI